MEYYNAKELEKRKKGVIKRQKKKQEQGKETKEKNMDLKRYLLKSDKQETKDLNSGEIII